MGGCAVHSSNDRAFEPDDDFVVVFLEKHFMAISCWVAVHFASSTGDCEAGLNTEMLQYTFSHELCKHA